MFFWQKFIFFFVFPVIHVQMKGSRLSPFEILDIRALWKSLRDVPNSHFPLRDEKTRLSVPGYKNSGTKDRQNRSFSFQGQCTQKHIKYWNSGTKRHDFYRFWENFNIKTDFFLKITSGSTRNFSHLLSNSGDEQVTCLACKILTRTILTQS